MDNKLKELIEQRIETLKDKRNNITLIDCLYNKHWNRILYNINNEIELLENELK